MRANGYLSYGGGYSRCVSSFETAQRVIGEGETSFPDIPSVGVSGPRICVHLVPNAAVGWRNAFQRFVRGHTLGGRE